MLARFDELPHNGCWFCVDAEIAIGQCRVGVQPLAPPAEDVLTGLEFPVDLPL